MQRDKFNMAKNVEIRPVDLVGIAKDFGYVVEQGLRSTVGICWTATCVIDNVYYSVNYNSNRAAKYRWFFFRSNVTINWSSCKQETFDDKPPRAVRKYASSAQMLCLKIQKELNEVKKE